ncbi:PIG-L deacetylase family protein [uncultured Jatrophihabitans sp.]|uniref:PIG-L deacetylase family protein n=1 Tax=uncultured Jatrophihabitans sp. TaxID=1610747 RepID=UPI0035CBAEDD
MTTVLVVVAHPDDETFGCGSSLLHAAERGARTVVVCATRGEAGEVRAGVDAPDGVAALREAELRASADLLGVGEVEVLDFVDSGMGGEAGPATLVGAPDDQVREAVRSAIDRHHPDVVITLDGGDGHRDHLRVREAVEQVLAGTSTVLYLHCLPRSLMHAWVRHHAGDQDAAAYTELPAIGTPDDELTTVLETGRFLAERDAAIALHRSQVSPFEGLPDELRRAFLGNEHLIRVHPAWTGGERETELTGLA